MSRRQQDVMWATFLLLSALMWRREFVAVAVFDVFLAGVFIGSAIEGRTHPPP